MKYFRNYYLQYENKAISKFQSCFVCMDSYCSKSASAGCKVIYFVVW